MLVAAKRSRKAAKSGDPRRAVPDMVAGLAPARDKQVHGTKAHPPGRAGSRPGRVFQGFYPARGQAIWG